MDIYLRLLTLAIKGKYTPFLLYQPDELINGNKGEETDAI
jgi:hypothetical protein